MNYRNHSASICSAFRRTAGPDASGKDRWSCPAQQGKVICANCPMSALLPAGTPVVENPPTGELPKACTQVTVTIPGEVSQKLRQNLVWGSREWTRSYNRRTLVEGAFGYMKNRKTGDVDRGWCFLVGLVKTSICLAVAICALNMRKLRKWAEKTNNHTDPRTAPDPEDYGFEELGPDGTIAAHGPPQAA